MIIKLRVIFGNLRLQLYSSPDADAALSVTPPLPRNDGRCILAAQSGISTIQYSHSKLSQYKCMHCISYHFSQYCKAQTSIFSQGNNFVSASAIKKLQYRLMSGIMSLNLNIDSILKIYSGERFRIHHCNVTNIMNHF